MARIDFDIEKARNGAKLVTRDGRPARIICYDRNTNELVKPLLCLIVGDEGFEYIKSLTFNGKMDDDCSSCDDLFIEVPDRWCIVVTDNNSVEAIFPGVIYYDYEHINRVFQTIQHKKKRIVKIIEA